MTTFYTSYHLLKDRSVVKMKTECFLSMKSAVDEAKAPSKGVGRCRGDLL